MSDDYDNPWKETLDLYFPLFLAFFFPAIFADVDWDRGYQTLDKELLQIVREGELGKRLADKLFKVWLRGGQEVWVLIHIEIQNQFDYDFAERMYVYHYRIYDHYRRPVVSLAVLGDERRDWRPSRFTYSLWDCTIRLDFPTVKLLEYANRIEELEAATNPFAAVVLAHIKTTETKQDPVQRNLWKIRVVKGLFERGLSPEDIRQFFRIIDWLMALPPELEQRFKNEIHQYEEDKKMPYVTSIERLGREEGLEEGLAKGRVEGLWEGIESLLEVRFGVDGLALMPAVKTIEDVMALRTLHRAIQTCTTLDEVRRLFP